MGVGLAVRRQFVDACNTAFGPSEIAATSQRLQGLPPTADLFDMFDHLGLLTWVPPGQLDAYRQTGNTMSKLSRHVLTHVLHHAIGRGGSPTPMHLEIIHGPMEAIAASTHNGQHHVVLTRSDYDKMR